MIGIMKGWMKRRYSMGREFGAQRVPKMKIRVRK